MCVHTLQAEALLGRAQARVQKLRKLQQMLEQAGMSGTRTGLFALRRSVDMILRSGSEEAAEGWGDEYIAQVGPGWCPGWVSLLGFVTVTTVAGLCR